MSGNYVNFGVFELYGDPALKVGLGPGVAWCSARARGAPGWSGLLLRARAQEALEMVLRLVLSVPMADIMAFRKLSRAYFSLLEVLAHNHTAILAAQVRATAG